MTVNLWAVCMVLDEADVIETTLRHVAGHGVAGIIVSDNGSTDGTREILAELERDLDCEFFVIDEAEVGYWQSRRTTALAQTAAEMGAEWIWPCDADEIWNHSTGNALADVLVAADGDIIRAELYNHYRTGLDPEPGNVFEQMPWRWGQPQPLAKIIVRWMEGAVIHAGNHGADHPFGRVSTLAGVRVDHFPYRSAEQFISKAVNGGKAYAATDLPDEVGAHWRGYYQHYLNGGEDALREIYETFFVHPVPTAVGMCLDPVGLKR